MHNKLLQIIKRYLFVFGIATIIALPLAKPLLAQDSWYESDESFEYLIKGATTKEALKEGVFKQEWSHLTQKTVGDYTLIMYPPLSHTTIAVLSFLTGNTLTAGKFTILLISITGIAGVILLLQEATGSKKGYAPYIASLCYTYLPYRLYLIYDRGALPEAIAITTIPFTIWGILNITKKKYTKGYIITTTSIVFLLSSHLLSSIIIGYFTIALTLLLFLFFARKIKFLAITALSGLSALALSATTWLPIMLERGNLNTQGMNTEWRFYGENFYLLKNYLGIGNNILTLNTIIVIATVVALFPLVVYYNKKKSKKKEVLIFLLFLVLFIIFYNLTQPRIFNPIGALPMLDYVQFIYRLASIPELLIVIIIGLFLNQIESNKLWMSFAIITLLSLIIGPKIFLNIEEKTTYPEIEHVDYEGNSARETMLIEKTNPEALAKGMCKKKREFAVLDEYAPTTTPYTPAKEIYLNKDCSSLIGIYIAPQDREKIESVDITTQTITVTLKKDKEDSITLLQRNNTQWETTSGIREEELGYLVINNITEKTFTLSQRPLRSVLLGKIISGATLLTLLGLLTYFIIKKQNNGKEK